MTLNNPDDWSWCLQGVTEIYGGCFHWTVGGCLKITWDSNRGTLDLQHNEWGPRHADGAAGHELITHIPTFVQYQYISLSDDALEELHGKALALETGLLERYKERKLVEEETAVRV